MSQYQTGTVTVTNGSATVTGSGTAWLNTIEPGHVFVRATMVSGQRIDDLVYYTVASVQSNTQLTLTAPYGGTSGSGQPYGITRELSPGGIPLLAQRSIGSVPIFNGAVVDLDARTAAAEQAAEDAGQAVSELGTAAFEDVTTSATDTTSGRLLKVGDFGLGSDVSAGSISDCDNALHAGFYSVAATASNRPPVSPTALSGLTVMASGSAIRATQICSVDVNLINSAIWFRQLTNDGWSTWKEFYHTGNTIVDSNGFIKEA